MPFRSEVSFWSNFCGNYSEALSENPVIFVMVSCMYNNAKDVKTEIGNNLRVFAPFSLNRKTTQRKEQESSGYTPHRHNLSFFCISVSWMCDQSLTPPFASLRLSVFALNRERKGAKARRRKEESHMLMVIL